MADDLEIGIGGDSSSLVSESSKGANAVKGVSSAADQLQAAFKRLMSSIDPLFNAQEKYNKSLADNRALLAEGLIGVNEYRAGMAAAVATLNEAQAAIERNSAGYKAQQAAQLAAAEQAKQQAAQEAAAVAAAEAQKREAAAQTDAMWASYQKDQAASTRDAASQAGTMWKQYEAQRRTDASQTNSQLAAEIREYEAQQREASQQAAANSKATASAARAAAKDERDANRQAAQAARDQAKEERDLNASLIQLKSGIDPVYAAQLRYNDTMQKATQLLLMNKLGQGEWVAIQKQALVQQDINTRSIGRMNNGYINLGYQMQDVVASAVSGISPLVIIAQQAGQTASAVSQMGGKFASVASFIAGPWGAIILGAVTVLGFLIPKLLDTVSAQDRMAQSQKDLRQYIDETTGAIKDQTTALQLRGAAQNNEQLEKDAQKKISSATNKASGLAESNIQGAPSVGIEGGVLNPDAGISSRASVNRILQLNAAMQSGKIDVIAFSDAIATLSKSDPEVKKLSDDLTRMLTQHSKGADDSIQDFVIAKRKAVLTNKMLNGEQLTDDQKMVLGIKTQNQLLGQSYFEAMATYQVATDPAEKAQAKLVMVEAEANIVREKAIATAKNSADAQKLMTQANLDYVKTVGPYKKAVDDAKQAKKDESKAAREAYQSKKDDLEYEVENLQYEQSMAVDDYNKRVALQEKIIAALIGFYGRYSREVARAQRTEEQMANAHRVQLREIADKQLQDLSKAQADQENTRDDAGKQGETQKTDKVSMLAGLGLINGKQEIAARRQILDEEYQMEVDHQNRLYQLTIEFLNLRMALYPVESKEFKDLKSQIQLAESQHDQTMLRLAQKNSTETNKINLDSIALQIQKWKTYTDVIGQGFNQMFQGIWTHSQSFLAGIKNIGDQLVFTFVSAQVKILTNWLAGEAAKLAASLFTHKAIDASAAVSATTQTAVSSVAAATQIGNNAAVAAAGAYSSTVVIPFIGPVTAPAAAALALAAVLGFGALISSAAGGQWQVPNDGQITELHKDEMVLPAWAAKPLRAQIAGSGPRSPSGIYSGASSAGQAVREANASGGQGDVKFEYKPTHSYTDMSAEKMLQRDGGTFRRWVKNELRNGTFKFDGKR